MNAWLTFWSYGLAACAFASVVLWRVRSRLDRSNKLLLAACFATSIWALVAAVWGRVDPITMTFATLRNFMWIVLLYEMAGGVRSEALSGVRLVFGAVTLAIGLHLVLGVLSMIAPLTEAQLAEVLETGSVLRMTVSAGALVLVHNIYGQAAPESRLRIRGPMLGLTLMWGYDLNLSTIAYLQGSAAPSVEGLFELRGLFMSLLAPLFAWTGGTQASLKIKLSRAATFQSLSLIAVMSYLALMAILAGALRHSDLNWGNAGTAALFVTLILVAAVLVQSEWARGWVKVKIVKHLFEHRFDYRAEWLRFTDTLGRAGADEAPLTERIVKAFADIADAPGGLLLVGDGAGGMLTTAASWNWPADPLPAEQMHDAAAFWAEVERGGRVLDFEGLRQGWASSTDKALPVPRWLIDQRAAWAGIPLVHHGRPIGLVILAAPEYKRALDWEDFDLLRTAGRQAASALAEAQGQEALAQAQRFEEFNRRFAFILHDIKNLVSQLSLVARNAERHADNPEFRADMVATLQSSVGKMNDLLARLVPHSGARARHAEAQPLGDILAATIAAKRAGRDVRLAGDIGAWALVDPATLGQAVGHLLQNAVEASPAESPVTVRVSSVNGSVAIAISDHGSGMDPDFIRNRLFQPFVSTKTDGFGIGAFEAQSSVAAMGGRISVESRPGHGTTFTIHLPAADAPAQPIRNRA
ncbi:MAG: XrtA/PEP-CTERM system histidine kinase PrsK [Sphingomicrobium sp.]